MPSLRDSSKKYFFLLFLIIIKREGTRLEGLIAKTYKCPSRHYDIDMQNNPQTCFQYGGTIFFVLSLVVMICIGCLFVCHQKCVLGQPIAY